MRTLRARRRAPAACAELPAPEGPREPGYFELTGDAWVSLVLVLPLLALYQVGIMLVDFEVLNGVDFLTRYVFTHHGLKGIVVLNLSVFAAFFAAIIRLENQGRFRVSLFGPLLIESAGYAWLLGAAISFALEQLSVLGVSGAQLAASLQAFTGEGLRNLVLSVGAGVYEELVFRLVLIAVLQYIFRDLFEVGARPALALALGLSSLLFAGAHHVGPCGEPFYLTVFLLRSAAGLLFAALYKMRSFAVAVYAHAIYDVYVLVLW